LVSAISYFHIYLANSTFDVYTDHKALTWLNSIKHTQARIKGLLKLGYPNTGAVIKACFNVLKAFSQSLVHLKLISFVNKRFNGVFSKIKNGKFNLKTQ
jgi:hypothetical protein